LSTNTTNNQEKLKTVVLGNFITRESNEVFLRKFLKLLSPISEKIWVISDWNYKPMNKRIEVVDSIRLITRRTFGHSFSARLAQYFLIQTIICVNLLKVAKRAHIVFVFDVMMVLPILLAKVTRKKVVIFAASRVSISSYDSMNFKKEFLTGILALIKKIIFALSNLIIVESQSLIQWLDLGRYQKKIYLSSTFVDLDVFRIEKYVSNRSDLVGYIGALEESKGVMQFVKSIPLVLEKQPGIQFLIGGCGPCHLEIKRFIKDYNLSNKVEIIGWVPNSKVPKQLNRLKLLVLPSNSEGLPNIMIEAMACGTPVLGTGVGGVPDILTDGETGFVLGDSSPASIAKDITKVLNYPKLLEITQKASALIESKYSYESAVRRFKNLKNVII
jgi:glycosyltransferase involved in cell wall biosynthesis